MPTYVYACTECGHRFEQYQAFTDAALTECPACSSRLRKLFNNVGVVFKGSGFYRNDSRKNSSEAAPAADGGTKDGSKSGSDDAKVGAAKGSSDASGSGSGSSGSGSSGSGSSGSGSSGSGSSDGGKSGGGKPGGGKSGAGQSSATSAKSPVKTASGGSAA